MIVDITLGYQKMTYKIQVNVYMAEGFDDFEMEDLGKGYLEYDGKHMMKLTTLKILWVL